MAERLIEIWSDIKHLAKFWLNLPKSKRPSSKSYEVVVEAVADPLVVAKLHFFSYVASLLKPYLSQLQSEQPVMLYLQKELLLLCGSVLEMIIQPDIWSNSTGSQLTKIDFSERKFFFKEKRYASRICSRM